MELKKLHTAQDFNPEEGMKLRGWTECTILRGKVIFEKGKVVGEPGDGESVIRPLALHEKR